MLAPVRITAPVLTPITLAEAKAHLRVVGATDDDIITSLIAAATEYLDGWSGVLGRALVTQTWRQDYSGFCDKLRLPLAPVVSISSVKYFDGSNIEQTLADTAYQLLVDGLGPYVALKSDQSWPAYYGRANAVSITFVAGSAPEGVPSQIKAAIKLLVGNLYENREATVIGTITSELPFAVNALIAPYRRVM